MGVSGFLLAGVEPAGWGVEEEIARRHPDVAFAIGVHPQIVAEVDEATALEMVGQLAAWLGDPRRPRPAAIGELGLDAVGERKATLERQERLFRAQLALAREHDLPVVLHLLRAHGRALSILRRDGLPRRGGVVHSYSGGAELVRDYARLGLHLAVAGPVTWGGAERSRAAAAAIPDALLLVETDAPDQPPEPHRGGLNEPAYLPAIVAALAHLRGVDARAIAALTEANARRLFDRPAIGG